jgi:hypothetical protein
MRRIVFVTVGWAILSSLAAPTRVCARITARKTSIWRSVNIEGRPSLYLAWLL